MKNIFLGTIVFLSSLISFAGPYYISGTIIDHTAITDGLMIKVTGGLLPDNCKDSPFGWMIIPETRKTITAITLLSLLQNKTVTVYTSGMANTTYCEVTQVDPEG